MRNSEKKNYRRKNYRRKMSMLLTGVLLISGLTACQKTPTESTVIQKDQEQMLKTAGSLKDNRVTVKDQVEVPEKSQFRFSDSAKKLSVTVDAEVILPEKEQIPIIQVEARKFNQEDVDAWVDYFFKDDTLYSIDSVSVLTKEEYQKIQLQYKKELADKEALLAAGNQGQEEELNEQIESLQSYIEYMDHYIESAPETNKWLETDSTIQEGPGAHVKTVRIAAPSLLRGGYKYYNYDETNYTDEDLDSGMYYAGRGDTYILGYSNADILSEDAENDLEYADVPDVKMTREEAIKYGDEVVKSLDLDENLSLASCQKGIIHVDDISTAVNNTLKVWNLTYALEVEGIPVPYGESAAASSEGAVPWSYKLLNLMIDDQGVVQADFSGPCEIKETLVENCKLLPYETITEIFRKMMLLEETWYDDMKVLSGEARVTRIQLGYARITSQNQVGVGMLVPAWYFYGSRSVMLEEYDQPMEEGEMELFVINAIDGSVISLDNGY